MTDKKNTNSQGYSSDRSRSSLAKCPVKKVLRANENGIVIETNRSFDIGEEMTLGFHVMDGGEGTGHFISADSLVVASERCITARGDFRHRVTLLFSQISSNDRERLIRLSETMNHHSPAHLGLMGMN